MEQKTNRINGKQSGLIAGLKLMIKRVSVVLVFLITVTLSLLNTQANAMGNVTLGRADHSEAVYEEIVEDMRVKVIGGYVKLKRKHNKNGWQINSNWMSLKFLTASKKRVVYRSSRGVDPAGLHTVLPGESGPAIRSMFRGRYRYRPVSDREPDRFVDEYNPGLQIVKTTSGYRWSDRKGNWIDYQPDGRIKGYGKKNNIAFVLKTDKYHRVTKVIDQLGIVILTYDYGPDSHLPGIFMPANGVVFNSTAKVVVTDYQGRKVTYHGSWPYISKVTDVNGNDWKYEYKIIDGKRYLNKKIDPENRTTIIGHELVAGGPQVIYTPGNEPVWSLKQEKDPATGEVFIKEVFAASQLSKSHSKTIMVPDAVMFTHKIYSDGKRIDYRYFYNPTTRTYSLLEESSEGVYTEKWFALDGKMKRYTVGGKILFTRAESKDGRQSIKSDPQGRKTTTYYNQWEKVSKIIYPDNTSVSYQYHPQFEAVTGFTDENGHKTKHKYDSKGNRIKTTYAYGTVNERVVEMEYNTHGQAKIVRRIGDINTPTAITQYLYDNFGNVTQVTDPEGFITRYEKYTSSGKAKQVTDPKGKIWLFKYNASDDLIKETSPLKFSSTMIYNKVGLLTHSTDPNQNTTQFSYDARNRLLTTTDPLLNSSTVNYSMDGRPLSVINEEGHQHELEYDGQQRLKKISNQENIQYEFNYENEDGTAVARLDNIVTPHGKMQFSLNEKGRVIQQTRVSIDGALSLATGFEYTPVGQVKKNTDAENNTLVTKYNEHGEVIKTINALNHELKMDYDSHGNLIKVTDQKGSETRYEYDLRGLKTAEIKPMGQKIQYKYDANQFLIRKIDSKSQITQSIYDDGRLSEKRYFINSLTKTPGKTITFQYNNSGYLTGYNDGQTSAVYTLDKMHRLEVATINYGTFSKSFRYGFYKDGKVAAFTNAESIKNSYQYDDANRLREIKIPGQGSVAVGQYKGYKPVELMYPGGIRVTNTYDGVGRLIQENVKDPAKNPLQNSIYTLDKVGNVTNKKTSYGNFDYGYSPTYRLTSAKQPAPLKNREYEYDPVGNRLKTETVNENWTYNTNHQLQSYGTKNNLTSFIYDKNGSTVSQTDKNGVEEYVYNIAGRLSEIKRNGTTVASYYYDPFGMRLWKEVNGKRTYFLYANEGMLAEYNHTGQLIQSYLHVPETMWGTSTIGMIKNGEASFYQHDKLGTPNLLTSKSGRVLWQGKIDAFGEVFVTTSEIDSPLRFPGQYYDGEGGLHQNYFRDYNVRTGRYLQSDPIGLMGGVNTYGYVGGNPVMYYDPYGLWAWGDPLPQSWVDGAAGFGDTISFGATSGIRNMAGIGSVNKCSSAYSNGEWAAIGLSVGFGGVHLGRNALNQMGRRGNLTQRLQRGVGRIFSDSRTWGAVRNMWSRATGNGTAALRSRGQQLHHWFRAQSRGGGNSAFNYMPVSSRLNNIMGNGTLNWTQRISFNSFRGLVLGIYGAAPTSAVSNLTNDECGC